MTDFSTAQHAARERLKIKLAQAELTAQLNGAAPVSGTSFGAACCPTQARERHQQRLANIKALGASGAMLRQEM